MLIKKKTDLLASNKPISRDDDPTMAGQGPATMMIIKFMMRMMARGWNNILLKLKKDSLKTPKMDLSVLNIEVLESRPNSDEFRLFRHFL